eukprot:CAMPEP_0113710174 /NCGR_PEP_ID=MMETSP0038_2-20120614/29999_1 /TAXON_ID=2898 /ORGANISM="Cryptomonas paramecium" /LENGTH=47 /DNA_ID=CAMNT_0000636179 /DNA_START=42 /DNA_END=181 /DNA_ORIENTATION=- /assembly_acc=CAM_ASM_000170
MAVVKQKRPEWQSSASIDVGGEHWRRRRALTSAAASIGGGGGEHWRR